MMMSPTQLEARLDVTSARALSYLETIAAGMSAFVYLKRAGKQRR
jgi:hypothetical protein